MKTMFELLLSLHEVRTSFDRVRLNPQVTDGEKSTVRAHKELVRECLPAVVLVHYDRMSRTERMLRSCPEVFAMAVLVTTYRSLDPQARRRLAAHFAVTPVPAPETRAGARRRKPAVDVLPPVPVRPPTRVAGLGSGSSRRPARSAVRPRAARGV